ncbi:hypothetical protein RJ639_016839 [Escallonia herrerae]|uniref:Ubiquitin-like domain-containing protein n=1 Tax=Escallonia herrerae TaxID=1293975 RepID=A0AA89ALI7_9ASTE|nr:hypothetical protein RJ639_016839 [Escallonia herrerae]
MKVIVEILTGKVFNIQVDKDATVAELKREIEAQEDLPNNRLILMFEGSLLNGNEAPLVEYGVGEGSHKILRQSEFGSGVPEKVIVEILTGKVFNIQVDKDATVAELKREIEAQEDLPNNRLILMFKGSLLNRNEASLVEYGVGEGSHNFRKPIIQMEMIYPGAASLSTCAFRVAQMEMKESDSKLVIYEEMLQL